MCSDNDPNGLAPTGCPECVLVVANRLDRVILAQAPRGTIFVFAADALNALMGILAIPFFYAVDLQVDCRLRSSRYS
jgi:hypothetical protein